ncbi:TIGR02117 family protein [soil metagenome]
MKHARRTIEYIANTAFALVVLLVGYAAAGLIGGSIPANAGWTEPGDGVQIWVESNGVHTGLVLPKVAAGIDWRGLARPEHLADPRYGGYDHIAFGWGERTFYVETPTWADVRPKTVLAAAIGSDRTLMHVDHLPAPAPGAWVRPITLRPAEYRRLAAFIRASFEHGGSHQPGYGPYDAFYEGRGHYSGLTTCNAWTGAALRYAGVRVGQWTPFPVTVMGWFQPRAQ